jgi:molybdopterin converting factor small subunit
MYLEPGSGEQKLKDSLMAFRAKRIDIVRATRLEHKRYQKTVGQIVRKLRDKIPEAFDAVLREIIEASAPIDALYVINDEGIQITDTCMKKGDKLRVSPIFRAASKNENLSYKDYFYQLMNTNLKKYTTDAYISYATGNLCVTLSRLFKGKDGRPYILCTDFLIGKRFP